MASKNVLDEVYFALEQGKRVIPVIVKDADTPYRLQRIQHVDFSISYSRGLNQLLSELKGVNTPSSVSNVIPTSLGKNKSLLLLAVLLVVTTALFFILKKGKKTSPGIDPRNNEVTISPATITGRWNLVDVTPKVRESRGQLQIEQVSATNINIKSSLQFYYFKPEDTVFLEVFNGFAGCDNCTITQEIPLVTEDAALGWRILELKTTQGSGGQQTDTLLNAGYNQSFSATSSLEISNDSIIKIRFSRKQPIPLSPTFTIPQFEYLFTFRKSG